MKKIANINFILAVILIIGLLLPAFTLGKYSNYLDSGLEYLQNDMDERMDDGSIDDVEGWGLILEGIGLGLGTVANVVLIAVIVIIVVYALLLFLFALIARLVYAPQGGRLVAYRILMSIEYILQLLLIAFFIFILTSAFMVKILIYTILASAGLIYSAYNTYSKRIKGTSAPTTNA